MEIFIKMSPILLIMAWYVPEEHGSIEDFVKYCEKHHIPEPCFKGFEQFELLWRKGYLEPNESIIRLAYGIGPDYVYRIINEKQVEGVEAGIYSGKPGIHNIKELLSDEDLPYWIAGPLNIPPKPRS